MFFVLRSKDTARRLVHRDTVDNNLVTTNDLQQAKLFQFELLAVTETVEGPCHGEVTTGELSITQPSPPIPAGLYDEWGIVLVDLSLA